MSLSFFISYITKNDFPYVKELKKTLENDYSYEVFLAPERSEYSIKNSEKISKYIDMSQIFISIMSEDALKLYPDSPNWLHQELGYAYNHFLHGYLQIIIISDNKDYIKGFINPITHDLSIIKGDPHLNASEIHDAITGGILKKEDLYPLKLDVITKQISPKGIPGIRQFNLEVEFIIHNNSFRDLNDGTISFIFPKEIFPDFTSSEISIPINIDRKGVYVYNHKSNNLPEKVSELFEGELDKIARNTFYLGTVHALNAYEFSILLQKGDGSKDYWEYNKIKFGILIKLPIFGISLYQGCVSHITDYKIEMSIKRIDNNCLLSVE